jgi:biopolymer transport protein ExbD
MAGAQSAYDEDEGSTLSDINVVPLVDVVLVLLIVFMITVPAVVGSAPIKVDLPETVAAAILSQAEDLPLHLFLRREQSGEVALYLNDNLTDRDKLDDYLKKGYVKSKEKPTTFVAADKTIPYGEVIKVIDMLGSLGLHKISLDTKHVSGQ